MEQATKDTPWVHFTLTDGILILRYKEGLQITVEIAQKVVEERMKFVNGASYPLLIKDSGVVSMDKAARDFFSSEAGTVSVKAAALMLDSTFSRLLGNFFLKITKPKIPARIFTDEVQAVEWLQQFKN